MDNAALAAGHGAEEKRLAGLLHFGAGSLGRQAELFDAEEAIVVRVENDEGVVFMRQPEHFHGEVLQGKEEFGFVFEEAIGFLAAELYNDVGVFDFGVGRSAFVEFIIDVDVDAVEEVVEKVADFVFVLIDGVFTSHVCRTRLDCREIIPFCIEVFTSSS
jgi:hypothetical protein